MSCELKPECFNCSKLFTCNTRYDDRFTGNVCEQWIPEDGCTTCVYGDHCDFDRYCCGKYELDKAFNRYQYRLPMERFTGDTMVGFVFALMMGFSLVIFLAAIVQFMVRFW